MTNPESLTFERVVVINLDRDHERLARFFEQLPAEWPFPKPARFSAIDGSRAVSPPWWQVSPAAWGCFRSHYQVIENALNDNVESLLIFEDDAVFVKDFSQKLAMFAHHLPSDWEIVYLGGQHIRREVGLPIRISEHVYRPYNVHRSHAYGLRGRRALETIYKHLNDRDAWSTGHHVDHRLGELHRDYPGGVYVPNHWLVGQGEGFSNIKKKNTSENFFPSAEQVLNATVGAPMLPVVGVDSVTRNVVAALLHRLGAKMGEAKRLVAPHRVTGAFAAPGLDQTCEQLFSDPWWIEQTNFAHRRATLQTWASKRADASGGEHSLLGGTHSTFCLMAKELSEAWQQPKVVVVSPRENLRPNPSSEGWRQMQWERMSEGLKDFTESLFDEVIEVDLQQIRNEEEFVFNLAQTLGVNATSERLSKISKWLQRWTGARHSNQTHATNLPQVGFHTHVSTSSEVPFFAVLGPHRSGTSCVAMMMHHLGLHMGSRLSGYETTGGGEASDLALLCENAMPFPLTDPVWRDEVLSQRLGDWCAEQQAEAQQKQSVAGGKYPHLCRFAEHLVAALGPALRVVCVDRPIEQAIDSLQRRSRRRPAKWYSAEDALCSRLQHSLLGHREQFLTAHPDVPRHRIEYDRLLSQPAQEIDCLARFLNIVPTMKQREAAIAHVNPQLNHHA